MQHGEKEKESETAKLKNNRPMDRYCILNFQSFYELPLKNIIIRY